MTATRFTELFLCGDVMLGRGIDQLFARASEPRLEEDYVHDARDYIGLAESASGPISRPVSPAYVWGDALEELERTKPDARIINLETSVTTSDTFWPYKGINYRMHPENVTSLTVARVDVCSLDNNHVLDFGVNGLLETLATLRASGIETCGAGANAAEAQAPGLAGNVQVFGLGLSSSGIPRDWRAEEGRPGVEWLPNLSSTQADQLTERIARDKRPGALAIVSVHWGGNWGYGVSAEMRAFAHRLIDGGVDLVHGHSSHHPRPLEVYRGKLVLYGCGDFINDYEGISGYEEFRSDLRPMYFATLNNEGGRLERLRIVPLQTNRLRLRRASLDDARWLAQTLSDVSAEYGTVVQTSSEGEMLLHL